MTADELRQQIELKVVERIKGKLAEGAMSEARSQEISRQVLELLQPGMTFEELYKAIPKLDDSFPELSPVILPLLKNYETNVNQRALREVRELIRQGHYTEAVKLAERAISQDVKLVWYGGAKVDSTT